MNVTKMILYGKFAGYIALGAAGLCKARGYNEFGDALIALAGALGASSYGAENHQNNKRH